MNLDREPLVLETYREAGVSKQALKAHFTKQRTPEGGMMHVPSTPEGHKLAAAAQKRARDAALAAATRTQAAPAQRKVRYASGAPAGQRTVAADIDLSREALVIEMGGEAGGYDTSTPEARAATAKREKEAADYYNANKHKEPGWEAREARARVQAKLAARRAKSQTSDADYSFFDKIMEAGLQKYQRRAWRSKGEVPGASKKLHYAVMGIRGSEARETGYHPWHGKDKTETPAQRRKRQQAHRERRGVKGR